MPAPFMAFIILVVLAVIILWLVLSRGFEKLGNFIFNKVLAPFGFGDEEEQQKTIKEEKKEEGDK